MRTGAARFLTGTPNVPALYAGTPGYDLIEEIGVERIREQSLRHTQLLIDLPTRRASRSAVRATPRNAVAPLRFARPNSTPCTRSSRERQILCDFRPDAGLRLGPHYYNTEDELRYAVGQIAEIVESGAYERHLGAVARF